MRGLEGPVDLTEDAALLRLLLSDTLAWRGRLVESFSFGASDHVRVTSTYQCELPPGLTGDLLPSRPSSPIEAVRALIPITTRPKQPLLSFDLAGPDGQPAHLLRRTDIAALQRGYLEEMISTSTSQLLGKGLSGSLIEAICAFTPGVYSRVLQGRPETDERDAQLAALGEYLKQALGLAASGKEIEPWVEAADVVAEILAAALGEPRDRVSSSENVLLALPLMDPAPQTIDEVSDVVDQYRAAIESARDSMDLAVLETVAEYGRRWDLVAEMEVPLGQPWLVRVAENRPLRWSNGRSEQVLSLGDAKSVHFQVSVTDPSVLLAEAEHGLTTLDGEELPFPGVTHVRDTSDTLSLYGPEPSTGPYYALLAVTFTRPLYLRIALWTVIALVVSAAGAACLVDAQDLVEKLAVLTVPTTFSAALLLTREETALAARIDAPLRYLLAVATVLLWAVTLFRLLCSGTLV